MKKNWYEIDVELSRLDFLYSYMKENNYSRKEINKLKREIKKLEKEAEDCLCREVNLGYF